MPRLCLCCLAVLEVLYSAVVGCGSPVEFGCGPVGHAVVCGGRVVVHGPDCCFERAALKLLGGEGCAETPRSICDLDVDSDDEGIGGLQCCLGY